MTKFWNTLRKYEGLKFAVGLTLIGLFFVIISIVVIVKPSDVVYEKTEATISLIDEVIIDDETEYQVYVTYTIAGEKYKDIAFGNYDSKMKVGDKVEIEYDVDRPDRIQAPGSEGIIYIFLVIGIGALGFGIFSLVKTIKTSTDEMNEFDKVDLKEADEATIQSIMNNTEEKKEYYFHFTGKLNQSYIMETPDRTPIYEANCDKITALKPFTFTFKNCKTGESAVHQISHVTTIEVGSSNNVSDWKNNIVTNSYFKIDGMNIWDYIGKLGYSLEPEFTGVKINFNIMHYGVNVARLEAAGTNVLNNDKDYGKLGDLPTQGLYKVYCKDSDIDAVFLAAFTTSRVEFI